MRPDAVSGADASPPGDFGDMIGVMALELTDLGTSITGLETLIGHLAELAGPALGPDLIIRMQDIDSVSQRLARLAQLARILQEAARDSELSLPSSPDLLEVLQRLDGARNLPGAGQ